MVIRQGDIWWADLGEPAGSSPGFRRPVIIVQGNALNRSRLATAVCVPLSSQLTWAEAPGNILLTKKMTGLSKDSVANVSQMVTVDKDQLTEHIGEVSEKTLYLILAGIDIVWGK